MNNWIEQYLALQAEEDRKRAVHRLASAIYPTPFGHDAGPYGPHTARAWAEHGLKALERRS